MLLSVSLTNTNNHGEKQAKASNLVESINQCKSDAWWLQFTDILEMLLQLAWSLQIKYHLLRFRKFEK